MSGRMLTALIAAGVVGWGAGGCDESPQRTEHPQGEQLWESAHADVSDGDEVVAEVDGARITVADVEAAWRDRPDWQAREVVEYLVEREVVAREARQDQYTERSEVAYARKQGLVRALLADEIETEAEYSQEAFDEWVDETMRQRTVPEGLRVSHLVIYVPAEVEGDDGEMRELSDGERREKFARAGRWIDEVADSLEGTVDVETLRQKADRLNEEVVDEPMQAAVHEHVRFPRHGEAFVRDHLPEGWTVVLPEFAQRAEEVADESLHHTVSEPVKTDRGWHLIRVDEIIEARAPDRQTVKAVVDRQLRQQARRQVMGQRMEQWLEGANIELFPERLDTAVDDD